MGTEEEPRPDKDAQKKSGTDGGDIESGGDIEGGDIEGGDIESGGDIEGGGTD
ncbi:MAG: hypothetical protein ACRDP9_26505 [Kribbellaceae bacterium]